MATPIKADAASRDEKYMVRCLELAREAAAAGEVPVGAVVVFEGRIIGEGRNRTRERRSALAHAEMIALEAAIQAVSAADPIPDPIPDSIPDPRADPTVAPASPVASPVAGGWAEIVVGRINGAVLYCSLEPCFMCAGALLHARVARVVFGAVDPKFGACGSLAELPSDPRLNHRCPVAAGLLAAESALLLREFFQRLR